MEDFPGFMERVKDGVNIHVLHEYEYLWPMYVGEHATARSPYKRTHFCFPFPHMPSHFFEVWRKHVNSTLR